MILVERKYTQKEKVDWHYPANGALNMTMDDDFEDITEYASDEDIFGDSSDQSVNVTRVEEVESGEKYRLQLKRAKELLSSGVPPPPSFTNPQINIETALNLFTNNNYFDCLENKWDSSKSAEELGYDVYLNSNRYVEELQDLYEKIQRRFVGCETSSLFSVWVRRDLTDSAKKKVKTNGWVQSPASRVKYLQRRKNTFSALCPTSNPKVITWDSRGGPVRDSRIGTAGKKTKRALFLSPEKRDHVRRYLAEHQRQSWAGEPPSSSQLLHVPSPSSSPRLAPDSNPKSVTSYSKDTSKPNSNRPDSKKVHLRSSHEQGKLSKLHRKKLMWAVTEVLKEFKASLDTESRKALFNETMKKWLSEGRPKLKVGTTQSMVNLARKIYDSSQNNLKGKLESDSNHLKKDNGVTGNNIDQNSRPNSVCAESCENNVIHSGPHKSNPSSPKEISEIGKLRIRDDIFDITKKIVPCSGEQCIHSSVGSSAKLDDDGLGFSERNELKTDNILSNGHLRKTLFDEIVGLKSDEDVSQSSDAIQSVQNPPNSDLWSNSELEESSTSSFTCGDSFASFNDSYSDRVYESGSCICSPDFCDSASVDLSRRLIQRNSKRKHSGDESEVEKENSNFPKKHCSENAEQANPPPETTLTDTSSGTSPKREKENDSNIDNTTELEDTTDWSPIIRLKRTSSDKWCSQLKKKTIQPF